jgi:hypothetical protein
MIMGDMESMISKNTGELTMILIAMLPRQYSAMRDVHCLVEHIRGLMQSH